MASLLDRRVRVFSRLAGLSGARALFRTCRVNLGIAVTIGLSLGGTQRISAQGSVQSAVRGTAFIVVHVIDSTQGRSLAGTATIAELHLEAALSPGIDTLRDLPEGSWAVRIRALGYAQRTVRLEARTANLPNAVVNIRMIPLAQTLVPVSVVARRDQRVLDDIDERMRVAAGTLIRAGDPFLATAMEASDAIRAGRGFTWKSPTEIATRRSDGRCKSAKTSTDLMPGRGRRTEVAVYLDGSRVPGGLETLNNMIRPDDILAIETYPEVLSAPFLWRTPDACAVVAFWSKHRAGS